MFLTGFRMRCIPLNAARARGQRRDARRGELLSTDVGSVIEPRRAVTRRSSSSTRTPRPRQDCRPVDERRAPPAPAPPSTSACSRSASLGRGRADPLRRHEAHHVADGRGVPAETDIVNLIKNGIPATEVSLLADAIVLQNPVLTRGSNASTRSCCSAAQHLPALQECWCLRIPGLGRARLRLAQAISRSKRWCLSRERPVLRPSGPVYGLHEAK
jgi:hypothetical protein